MSSHSYLSQSLTNFVNFIISSVGKPQLYVLISHREIKRLIPSVNDKTRCAAEWERRKTERVVGEWVVGGVDAFLLLNTHGQDRLCKCVNLIFKRTALPVGPMRANRAWHLAINPGRIPKSRSHIGSFWGKRRQWRTDELESDDDFQPDRDPRRGEERPRSSHGIAPADAITGAQPGDQVHQGTVAPLPFAHYAAKLTPAAPPGAKLPVRARGASARSTPLRLGQLFPWVKLLNVLFTVCFPSCAHVYGALL